MNSGTEREVRVQEDSTITGDGFEIRAAGTYVLIEDYWVPKWIELTVGGHDLQPLTYARMEMRRGAPALVDLRFRSPDDSVREVRQSDLREVQVSAIVEDLVAGFTVRVSEGEPIEPAFIDTPAYRDALRRLQRSRAGKATRTISPGLLERVAEIYRENVSDRPTQAVQRAFAVSPRMASEYVQRARRRGLLPPTSPGKKKA